MCYYYYYYWQLTIGTIASDFNQSINQFIMRHSTEASLSDMLLLNQMV